VPERRTAQDVDIGILAEIRARQRAGEQRRISGLFRCAQCRARDGGGFGLPA
jgi:hypothetical protein